MSKYQQIVEMWQSYNITNKEDLEKYLHNFKILFAYHSGKIENEEITFYNTREIFEKGKVSQYNGSLRALFEQQNQKRCYDFLTSYIENKTPITISLIKEIHRILSEGTYDDERYISRNERPGEFKKNDYVTGVHEVGDLASEVEENLEELLKEINDIEVTNENIFTIATYLHVRFEEIHPFADGNGRAGRTLLNYYLMIHNHPPLIVYEDTKKLYYEVLQKYDETGEIASVKEFFIYQIERTWEKQLSLFEKQDLEKSKSLKDMLHDSSDFYNDITLSKIDQTNYEECINLSVTNEQNRFVASNMYSLAQAAYEPDLYPLAIYQGSAMIGFILYDFDKELDAWSMSRFMIDQKYQNQGNGKIALEKFIELFINTYGSVPLYTSAGVENLVAINLYQKFGFIKLDTFEYTVKDVVYKEIRMLLK